MSDNLLAQSEFDSAVIAPQTFSGDEPSVVTVPGTLTSGQNLVAGTVLGRITATGAFSQATLAGVDGTAKWVGVLVHDIDATSAAKPCSVYIGGCFNTDWLTWPASITAAQKLGAFDGAKLAHRPLYWSQN
jgi:hypothetical protein